jgi:CRISPR-associated DxTHG motif protein
MNDTANPATGPARRRRRLVSFLGTGNYEPTRHRFPDGAEGPQTRYAACALGQYVAADEIAIVATAEAKEKHRKGIETALREANLPAPTFAMIPRGESEDELWRQFAVVKELLRPPAGAEVALDVTHAFRSQPFFAAAVAAFVRAVDPAPAAVRVFYAAFEARQEGVTPVWELTPFVELVDWAQNMMLFLRTGRVAGVAEKTETFGKELSRRWAAAKAGEPPALAALGRELRAFGANLETIRTAALLLGDGSGSADRLAKRLEEARASAASLPPLADVLNRLGDEMAAPLLGASDHLADEAGHRALCGLARLYVGMGRWAEAAAVLREGWITRHALPAAAFGDRRQFAATHSRPRERVRRPAAGRRAVAGSRLDAGLPQPQQPSERLVERGAAGGGADIRPGDPRLAVSGGVAGGPSRRDRRSRRPACGADSGGSARGHACDGAGRVHARPCAGAQVAAARHRLPRGDDAARAVGGLRGRQDDPLRIRALPGIRIARVRPRFRIRRDLRRTEGREEHMRGGRASDGNLG